MCQISCHSSKAFACARRFSLEHSKLISAQQAASANLGCMISNAYIFSSVHPTVLKFGEHTRVSVYFTPTKFCANRIVRSHSSKSGSASRPCVFDPWCSVTSNLDISASTGPISPRFREDVHLDVFYRSRVIHPSEPSRSCTITRVFVAH